ncbi:MAG TPA: transposase, partial [Stellaceae bacterium]|nr:transposase [Stellaceae bacterium]
RGLNGVQLIISDACRGLMESAAEYLPDAQWQRCMVHFYRKRLQPCAGNQGPRGEPHAQSHLCPGEP